MRLSQVRSFPTARTALVAALLVSMAATSGCSWFRKTNELYAQSPESRPLEVPPDLDRPRTVGSAASAASAAPAAAAASAAAPASATASATTPARAAQGTPIGFTTAGTRDDAFAKVDTALAAIEGVQVASRATALGVFDVNYQGSNFLVRVSEVEAGAYISAVDPRGLPATGEAPTQLIAALQGALGGN